MQLQRGVTCCREVDSALKSSATDATASSKTPA
jgi:hypothetical protein